MSESYFQLKQQFSLGLVLSLFSVKPGGICPVKIIKAWNDLNVKAARSQQTVRKFQKYLCES